MYVHRLLHYSKVFIKRFDPFKLGWSRFFSSNIYDKGNADSSTNADFKCKNRKIVISFFKIGFLKQSAVFCYSYWHCEINAHQIIVVFIQRLVLAKHLKSLAREKENGKEYDLLLELCVFLRIRCKVSK